MRLNITYSLCFLAHLFTIINCTKVKVPLIDDGLHHGNPKKGHEDDRVVIPSRIEVGEHARRVIPEDELKRLDDLPIALDRPEHFKSDIIIPKVPPPSISEEMKRGLMYHGSLAGVAYCGKDAVLNWNCGVRCDRKDAAITRDLTL